MATKFDKVVKREICQVSTPGTRTYSHLDGDSSDTTNKYLLALCEKVSSCTLCFSLCVSFIIKMQLIYNALLRNQGINIGIPTDDIREFQ